MSPIRVVLVGGADMLQDVIRQVVDGDPALTLVGESATIEGLSAVWERVDADVVIIRSLSADVPAAVLPTGAGAHIPSVLGVDRRGTRGVIILDDVSPTRLAAAIHAAAALRGHQETN
jgi:DNA-binding NarL/FixJ family response regulator